MSTALSPIPVRSVDGFRLGHYTDVEAATGCTAIVAPAGATGGVDVRGGAPASRETDLLRPENTVDVVHAVLLSGGSAFGLEAASGAARELEARGIGLQTGPVKVPIVCSSCIFDLGFGRPDVRPGVAEGRSAVAAALDGDPAEPLQQGTVGAGTGATVGKLLGPDHAMMGGLGAAAFALGPVQVGAIAAVNACGNVVDPATLAPVAGVRALADGLQIIDMEEALLAMAAQMGASAGGPSTADAEGAAPGGAEGAGAASAAQQPDPRANTTISCVITNARLTKAQATKLAQMAADAYAHAIRPTHTTNDGDTVYALASGALAAAAEAAGAPAPEVPLDLLGLMATRALEAAIVEGCKRATGLFGTPAWADLANAPC